MDLKIFDSTDPSGKMYKESFVSKNHIEEYDYIISYCENINLQKIPFKEKAYISINSLKGVPFCKNANCKNTVKFKNSTIGYLEYCSRKCVSSDPDVIKSKEIKSLEKFGTKSPSQSKTVKDKTNKTNMEKYGFKSAMCLLETQKKSKETLFKNHGVNNPSQSIDILQRRIQSFKKSDYRETYKKTSLLKYGTEHPWMNKEIHKKTIDFFYSSYRNRINKIIDVDNFSFIDFKKGITTNLLFRCNECDSNFDILPYQFYYRTNNGSNICTNCYPIAENASISQIEIYKFILKNYSGEVVLDCKNIITPYEIDIYLPELKLGFEFNGVWWHSEKFKGENYHLKKHDISISNNISLVTIWEDDWVTKRDICESFILNKIKRTKNKIYARNCAVKEISYNESKSFLERNHLQGDCKSSIRLGLYNSGELVTLMTFSKLRLPLQRKEENRRNENTYELTRFCNLINTNVAGGASKLLKYFIDKYKPMRIETYSDNLISNGDLYKTLDFEYSHTSKPGYWYVVDGIREHRFNWRKQRLIKMGHDSNKTEEEIMSEMGYYRIYNAGNKKWVINTYIY